MRVLPACVFLFERRLQVHQEAPAAVHLVCLVYGGRVPGAELLHLLHRLAVVAVIPSVENLREICGIAQPSCLHHVMAYGTGDEVIAVGVGALHEEFRHPIAHGRALDMLAQSPPAVVVHLLEVLLRTVEERHVPAHPFGSLAVGYGVLDVLVLHAVEVVHVWFVVVKLQYRSLSVGIAWSSLHIGDGEYCQRVAFVSARHVEALVGRGLVVGFGKQRTGAEHHSRDCLHRGVKLSLCGFLAVYVISSGVHVGREHCLDVVSLAGLVFLHEGAVARTALHLHHAQRIEHDA